MKALLGNHGFTISILIVAVIVAVFAFVLDAPLPLVSAMLVLGVFTALMEHILHSRIPSR